MTMVYTDRYALSGHVLPLLKDWMCETIGIDINLRAPAQVQSVFGHTKVVLKDIFNHDLSVQQSPASLPTNVKYSSHLDQL